MNDSGEHYEHYERVSDCFKEKINNIVKQDNIDIESGVNFEHLSELYTAVTEGKVKAVVFDWDRTLTKIEGLWNPDGKAHNIKTIEQYK